MTWNLRRRNTDALELQLRDTQLREAQLEEDCALLRGQLAASHEEIARLSQDCVTGVLGREIFERKLRGVFTHNRREDEGKPRPFGIIMLDVDNFKTINDTSGHRVGDQVLARVAVSIKSCLRNSDIVGRYGGDEFVVLLPNAWLAQMAVVCERIRLAICTNRFTPALPPVTSSIGFALQAEGEVNVEDIRERADEALYRAKKGGRNRVESELLTHDEIQMVAAIKDQSAA